MLCGYSSITSHISIPFSPNPILPLLFLGALLLLLTTLRSLRSPAVSGGATGLHLRLCFLFGRGETELGLLTAGNKSPVQTQSCLMMAAVRVMSIQAGGEKKERRKKKKTWDMKHHRSHPLLCKSRLKKYADLFFSAI